MKIEPHDFIRTGEEEEYAQTLTTLMHELTPKARSKIPSPLKSWVPPGVYAAAGW